MATESFHSGLVYLKDLQAFFSNSELFLLASEIIKSSAGVLLPAKFIGSRDRIIAIPDMNFSKHHRIPKIRSETALLQHFASLRHPMFFMTIFPVDHLQGNFMESSWTFFRLECPYFLSSYRHSTEESSVRGDYACCIFSISGFATTASCFCRLPVYHAFRIIECSFL